LLGGVGVYEFGDAVKIHMAHDHWLVCPSHVLWRHGEELCDDRECLRCVLKYRRPPQLWRHTGLLARKGRCVDTFIAMSQFSADKHQEMGFPFPMEVLPYFLGEKEPAKVEASPVHPKPFFLFVGRLEAIKGLGEVIELFRDLPHQDLLIAGDGGERASLEAQAEGCSNVRFLGRLESAQLDACYQQAQALIVPSLCYETFGIILIEAFRQGTPVIARRLGPFPEIVEKAGAGSLFTTTDELRRAVNCFADESARRETLGSAGRRAFEANYSETVVMPRYLELMAEAATKRGRLEVASRARASIEAVK
jgi:glycosyltransferase involved in cell wall biosynthesis